MDDADLKEVRRRMSFLEEEFEGEKKVSRYLVREVNALRSDVSEMRTDLVELRTKMTDLQSEFGKLRRDLPAIIGEAVADLLRK